MHSRGSLSCLPLPQARSAYLHRSLVRDKDPNLTKILQIGGEMKLYPPYTQPQGTQVALCTPGVPSNASRCLKHTVLTFT